MVYVVSTDTQVRAISPLFSLDSVVIEDVVCLKKVDDVNHYFYYTFFLSFLQCPAILFLLMVTAVNPLARDRMDSTQHQDLIKRVERLEQRMDERDARVSGPISVKELVRELKARKIHATESAIYKRLERDPEFARVVAIHTPGRRPAWKILLSEYLKQLA